MLNPFGRALVVYIGGAFPAALLGPLFCDDPGPVDETRGRRLLRRAQILSVLGLVHPVLGLAAFGLVRDTERSLELLGPATRRTRALALSSLTVSLLIAVGVLVATRRDLRCALGSTISTPDTAPVSPATQENPDSSPSVHPAVAEPVLKRPAAGPHDLRSRARQAPTCRSATRSEARLWIRVVAPHVVAEEPRVPPADRSSTSGSRRACSSFYSAETTL